MLFRMTWTTAFDWSRIDEQRSSSVPGAHGQSHFLETFSSKCLQWLPHKLTFHACCKYPLQLLINLSANESVGRFRDDQHINAACTELVSVLRPVITGNWCATCIMSWASGYDCCSRVPGSEVARSFSETKSTTFPGGKTRTPKMTKKWSKIKKNGINRNRIQHP